MKRLGIAIVVVTGMLVAGLIAAGCTGNSGGSGSLTLDEYFQKLDEHQNAFDDSLAALPTSDPVDVAETKDQLEQVTASFKDFADNLDGLEPPPEVATAHNSTVDGLRSWVDELNSAIDDVSNAESVDDALGMLSSLDTSGIDAAQRGCLDLQQIANENNISVDLSCNL